ncbi:MAG: hypothetical protein O7G87_14130 [bacterium]|nr:hypothetical protein [bacterium]
MKKWRTLTLGLSMAAMLWGGPVAEAQDTGEEAAPTPSFVDENGDGIDDRQTMRHRRGRRGRRAPQGGALMSVVTAELTEEQRAALQEKINGLMADGATKQQIQDAIHAELEAFGVDVTGNFLNKFGSVLTEEQMAGLQAKVDALKADGATYSDIQTAVRAELETLGIERPGRTRRGPGAHLGSVLTEEQRAGIQAKVDALIADGAPRTEIRTAINAELEALGVAAPQYGNRKAIGRQGRNGRSGMMRGRGGRSGRRGGFRGPAPTEARGEEATAPSDEGSSN